MMSEANNRQSQQVVVILTWIGYSSTYLLRKPLGVVKSDIAEEFSVSKIQLGCLDAALLLPYAIVQIIFSSKVDKLGARTTFGVCLLVSALSMVSFGSWQSFPVLLGLLFVNGAAQSLAWPSCVKALGDWFSYEELNNFFGLWGTCAFAGGIAGSAVAVYLQASHHWSVAFLIPALFVGYVGVLVLLFLPSPSQSSLLPKVKETKQNIPAPSWIDVSRIKLVKEAAVAVFCVKIVRYCMYMWLPMFLYQQLEYSQMEAGLVATVFEVGGVIGSATLPVILSKLFSGHIVRGTTFTLLASAVSFAAFFLTASRGRAANVVFMFSAGVTNAGVDTILTGIVPNHLSRTGKRDSKAAMSGFINGFGSLGTILEGPIIGLAAELFGWGSMLYLMIGVTLCGAVVLRKGEKHWQVKTEVEAI